MISRIFCLIILFLFCFSLIFGQLPENREYPKIGLVLSGGGAKGFAHLGVIKVLEEEGIPIDYIGGTSMGAIIGGLIASGISADSLIHMIQEQDWIYLLSDDIPHKDLYVTGKSDRDRYILSLPIINRKGFAFPQGIIKGQHIENMLHELTAPSYDIRDFSKLPIPFLCIAQDIDNDKEVVFRNGDLADAMRASMSFPTVFEPMVIKGNRFVDGGLVNNFPVKHIKEMGADIIIGVDVGYRIQNVDKWISLLSVMEDAVFYYSNMVKEENKKYIDIYIKPDLKGLGISSFTNSDSLIAYGEEAARQMLPEIRKLADSLRHAGRIQHPKPYIKHDSIFVKAIVMDGLKNLPARLNKASLDFDILHWVKPEEIAQTAENFYASNYFEKVTFMLEPVEGGARVHFIFREKQGGRLNMGIYYDSDYKTVLTLNSTFLNLLTNGTKLSTSLQLGKNPGAEVLFSLDKGPLLSPGIELTSNLVETYSYSLNRTRTGSHAYYISNARLFLQSKPGNKVLFQLGGEFNHTTLEPRITMIDFESKKDNFLGIYNHFYVDTRDRSCFPTTGFRVELLGKYFSNPDFHPIGYFLLDLQKAVPFSYRFSLVNELFGGLATGDSIPYQYNFRIGGQSEITSVGNISYPGYKFLEVSSTNLFYYRIALQYELFPNLFASLYGNIGTMAPSFSDITDTDHLLSGLGFTMGFVSPFGPMKFSLSKSGEVKGWVGYIQVGYSF